MLTQLYIDHVAVIDHAEVVLADGLTVLTGETGAGKSILIDALSAVLGERASRDSVRSGCPFATITAVFDHLTASVTDALQELGYAPEEDGTLILRRRISAENKSLCFIGSQPCTAQVMRRIGRLLVNIHGQHENQSLLSVDNHIDYLDRLGGLDDVRRAYRETYQTYCDVYRRLKSLRANEADNLQRRDILSFQATEIEEAALEAGEEQALIARRDVLRHADKLRRLLEMADRVLTGDEETDGVVSALEQTAATFKEAGRLMPEAGDLSSRLLTVLPELQDIAQTAAALCEDTACDPAELDRIEDRLELINRLCEKYGGSTQAVIAFGEQARAALDSIDSAAEEIAEKAAQLEAVKEELVARAATLTQARRKAAVAFSKDVAEELAFLDMPRVTLEVSIEPTAMTASGADRVEFLMSANPGEPPRSIAKIASGGELSRIMLALKSVLASADDIPTLIFDEIDTGISGRAASKVGYKLRHIASHGNKQVLCVTHLAQIAACAHHQLLIEKTTQEDRTFTSVRAVEGEARVAELARIVGGQITDASLKAAREMLDSLPAMADDI